MTKRLLRIPPLVGAVLAALTLTACGSDHGPITHGELESVNVRAGELVYQVQISRALNPTAVDDSEYLEGVAEPDLTREEQWFGVWIRAQNTTDQAHESTDEFKVLDAEGNEYEPVEIADTNPFKYAPRLVEKSDDNGQPLLPDPDSASGSGPIQGSMLLFKVPYTIYQNAPVELEIMPTEGGEASTVQLDM
ncbi:hypothetical protein [Conexibacter woesei]|uniref:DUF4352 domain-containing protein n=1 Tax=Conexibacter woesei (strain DSM 14684 / CCUG 47730 / CIP 108061 / JCM 11494 / NBRC 100937 / ID131577) TaxID=469383 RepID=D3F251_CONWI|nr:hypothetical protein [Conexibacter woesei]ADB50226.1 hypothetical protein Cwoe_1800 [Conexibacter woesei DSM 14684]